MHHVIIFLLLFSRFALGSEVLVSVDMAKLETVTAVVNVASRVVAREILVVSANVDERVSNIHVAVGDRISPGEILATLEKDNVALRIEVLSTEIAYLDTLIQLLTEQETLKILKLERANQLNTRDLLTKDATENAESVLIQTKTLLAKARYDLVSAKLELADAHERSRGTSIVAKTAGRIISISASVGQYVERGDELFRILADDGLELDAELRADVSNALIVGQIVPASLEGQRIDVKVRAFLAEENQRTGVRHVRFGFGQSPGEGLLIGQVVELNLPSRGLSEVLTIHKDTIMPTPRGSRVVLVVDGKAKPTYVTLGRGVNDRIVVERGISVGDVLVVQGQDGLRKDQSVRIVETD